MSEKPTHFPRTREYDAQNRLVRLTSADGSVTRITCNSAGLPEKLEIDLVGALTPKAVIRHIDYTPWGQRERVVYGNGVQTRYEYERATLRLKRLTSTRASDGAVLQDLAYTYDPAGNILEIGDRALQTLFFGGPVVSADSRFRYDAQGRLIEATGREHAGQAAPEQQYVPLNGSLLDPADARAMHQYRETYRFDAADNIVQVTHETLDGSGWVRHNHYLDNSNRLKCTRVTGERGQSAPNGPPPGADARVDCAYDAAGQRIRKTAVNSRGDLVAERIYLGDCEIYRAYDHAGKPTVERHTLHIRDGLRRVALVETPWAPEEARSAGPALVRYQLDNHLGSPVLELDEAAQVLSYEEYHPYGTTAYHALRAGTPASPKRYRFTGKERDAETGLCYHGARYYAPWLARWVSPDPAGPVDGPNLFAYARHNPLRFTDPTGLWSIDMHFAAVYWTGRSQSASHQLALRAALASQSLDDTELGDPPSVKRTDAPSLKRDSLAYCQALTENTDCDSPLNRKANNSHALRLTLEDCEKVVREGVRLRNPLLFGLGLHTVGDFLPHANLSGEGTPGHQIGFSEDRSPSDGFSTWADDTFRNPRKALNTLMMFLWYWALFMKVLKGIKLPESSPEEEVVVIGNRPPKRPSMLWKGQGDQLKDFVLPNVDFNAPYFKQESMTRAKESSFQNGLKTLGASDSEIAQVVSIWRADHLERQRIWAEGTLSPGQPGQARPPLFTREERERAENKAWAIWTSWANDSTMREGVTDIRKVWGLWTTWGGDWSNVPEYQPPLPKRFGEHPFHAK